MNHGATAVEPWTRSTGPTAHQESNVTRCAILSLSKRKPPAETSMRTRREARRLPGPALRLLAGLAVASGLMLAVPPASAATSSVTIGGPFTLVTSDGATVTDQTYRGKWLLVFFGFTFCPNTCPTTLLEITAALQRLGADADRLQVLFITVDPKRDTPEVMATYVRAFDPRIVGLTGSTQQIAAVAAEYGSYYAPRRVGPGLDDYVVDHGTYVYLMDGQGRFVRAFDADTPGDRIADAIRAAWRAARSPGSN
jgi:protein SCO1/2